MYFKWAGLTKEGYGVISYTIRTGFLGLFGPEEEHIAINFRPYLNNPNNDLWHHGWCDQYRKTVFSGLTWSRAVAFWLDTKNAGQLKHNVVLQDNFIIK